MCSVFGNSLYGVCEARPGAVKGHSGSTVTVVYLHYTYQFTNYQ